MSLNKKKLNLIISFDIENCQVQIMSNYGNDVNSATIERFDFDKNIFEHEGIIDILDKALESFFLDKVINIDDVYFVLPDNFVCAEYIKIPIMPSIKMKETLKAELNRLFSNLNEFLIKTSVQQKNKKNITYRCLLVKKDVVHNCFNVCKKHGLNIKNISYFSSAFTNSILALSNRGRHLPFLTVDIQANITRFMCVSKDKLIYSYDLPFGYLDITNSNNKSKNYLGAEYLFFSLKPIINEKKDAGGYLVNELSFKDLFQQKQEEREKIEELVLSLDSNKKNVNEFEIINIFIEKIKDDFFDKDGIIPDYAIINAPKRYEEKIKSLTSSLKIYYIDEVLIKKCLIKEFFNLYGMIYASTFNREQNIVDKERQNLIRNLNLNVKRQILTFYSKFKKNK